jgi:hypothetical protein
MIASFRFAPSLFVAALSGFLASGASAQTPEAPQPGGFCFEVIAAHGDAQAPGAILLDRCTGQTWVLNKTYRPAGKGSRGTQVFYRWKPIATENTRVAFNPPAASRPAVSRPAASPLAREKCFVFGGKRYCE